MKSFWDWLKSRFRHANITDIAMLLFVAWLFLLTLLVMPLIFKFVF